MEWAWGEGSKSIVEEASKAVFIYYGTELCTVGFLWKSIVASDMDKSGLIGHFAQIIELCDESTNKTIMLKSKWTMGITFFQLLDEI